METVGADCIASQPFVREDPALFLPFEQLPERDYIHAARNFPSWRTVTVRPRVDWSHNCDEGQLRLPIESQFPGISFRNDVRDPKSYGLATPVDELTKLPLPIVISDPPFPTANTDFWDYHHHYHPKRDLIYGDDAELALRRSRGQYLPRWLHEHYHHYFAGPEFPRTRQETFTAVVLACAGVVPRTAINFSKHSGPQIIGVIDNDISQRISDSIKHEGEKKSVSSSMARAQIGIFFANYAIEQAFEEMVSEKVIDEFLNTPDTQRRKVLGNLMLREAIDLSVEPIAPVHRIVKQESILKRRHTDLRQLIKDYFVRSRQPEYYQAIDRKLSVA